MALHRQLLLSSESESVTLINPAEALAMPAWQALITSGIDTHRALPVGVVVGQRMGDGGSGGEIGDASDNVESWSLDIACVETVLDSKEKSREWGETGETISLGGKKRPRQWQ